MPDGLNPYVAALVVSDAIWRDPSTGKYTILGTFTALAAPAFPAVHPSLSIYAVLTDGRQPVEITFQIVLAHDMEPADDRVIWSGKGMCRLTEPTQVSEVVVQLQGLTFPEAGEYRVQVLCDSEILMERRILLVHMNGGDHGQSGSSDS